MRHLFLLILLSASSSLWGQAPEKGKTAVSVRGQRQDIYYYPAAADASPRLPKVLFVPGDGGWRGFAIAIAQTVASWGYPVYGLDTKRYLTSFTGATTLKETHVMGDFRQIAGWMTQGSGGPVTLAGWSEGAGLCLLAAASEDNKKVFDGLVTIGLGESNVLGWRLVDNLTYITKREPNEPAFRSAGYMAKVAPLPLFMIHASRDEYATAEEARQLFNLAKEPKRFALVEAQNHRFDSGREEFFRVLHEALQWIVTQPR